MTTLDRRAALRQMFLFAAAVPLARLVGACGHIHFTVTVNGRSFTSQLVFDDTLCDAIISGQPLYKDRGARSTKNTNDSVVSASTYPQYLFETRQMTDGALLAWKSIVVS